MQTTKFTDHNNSNIQLDARVNITDIMATSPNPENPITAEMSSSALIFKVTQVSIGLKN